MLDSDRNQNDCYEGSNHSKQQRIHRIYVQVVEFDSPGIVGPDLVNRQAHRNSQSTHSRGNHPVADTVARTNTPVDNSSKRNCRPLRLAARKQSRMNSPIMKPVIFTTETQRVTIEPAISFALVNSNDRRTPNVAGATTAPKNNVAPTHALSSISLTKFRASFIQSQVFSAFPLSADYADFLG